MNFILGKKLGMTQVFDENGNIVPVTLVETPACQVTQVKTKEQDGYFSVQVGLDKIEKQKLIKKPQAKKPFKVLREFRINEEEAKNYELGKTIDISVFKEGDLVKVSGTSKGKGFQGPVKRFGFKGRLSVSHGTKHELRTPGSTGSSMPEHIIKGKKMAGHMGVDRISVKNLKVIKVDAQNGLLAIKGAVPGKKGTLLEISNI